MVLRDQHGHMLDRGTAPRMFSRSRERAASPSEQQVRVVA